MKKGASIAANNGSAPLQPRTYTKRGETMVAEKTKRRNGRKPFGKRRQRFSTVGRELAWPGQRVRWNAQYRRAKTVNR